jgi:dTDP-4-amino-4,6-dideoxy-D-galactose acyltransferase
MSYTIKILKWESDFFKKKIGEILMDLPLKEPIKLEDHYDFIITKQKEDSKIKIKGFTNSYKEEKITFSKNLKKLDLPLLATTTTTTTTTTILDTDKAPIKADLLFDLAYESGKHSRFKQDALFKDSEFEKLYQCWIINSINKTFGHKVFYILDNKVPIAFVTLNLKDNIGHIGLIAVDKHYQGQGLGKRIIKYIESYCVNHTISILKIPTQAHNKNASRFYTKLGYHIIQQDIIKHFWLKKIL